MVAVHIEPSGRRLVDFGIEMVDTVGRKRREPGHLRDLTGRPDGLPPLERCLGIDRIDVQVMKGRFRKRSHRLRRRLDLDQ